MLPSDCVTAITNLIFSIVRLLSFQGIHPYRPPASQCVTLPSGLFRHPSSRFAPTCLWTAYREGGFGTAPRPFLGYLFLLEDCPEVKRPVRNKEPYFEVDPVFKGMQVDRGAKKAYTGASYSQRYELLIRRLVRENTLRANIAETTGLTN
ncbi:MAG: PaeR7I family type II restriction endonuclease [Acidobacteriota bacterium]